MSWCVEKTADGTPCVYPENDLRPHDISATCWCRPTWDEGVIVHHSLDKRELFEAGRKPS